MDEMKFRDLLFEARSDVISLGRHPEDGSEMVGESYYVIAEDRVRGDRWRLWVGADSRAEDCDPEFGEVYVWVRVDEEAKAKAEALALSLSSGKLEWADAGDWSPDSPCYGSPAYVEAEAYGDLPDCYY